MSNVTHAQIASAQRDAQAHVDLIGTFQAAGCTPDQAVRVAVRCIRTEGVNRLARGRRARAIAFARLELLARLQ